MKCAIATSAIGNAHQAEYAAIFRPSVERYVARHGYDLLVFDDHVGETPDRDPRVIHLESLRMPFLDVVQRYDRLMVVDVDVLITAHAPPLEELDLGTAIGVVDEWCQPSREERARFQEVNGLPATAADYHQLGGFTIRSDIVINAGMFICSPRIHGAFFRDLIARYTEIHRHHPLGPHFEQAMLSYELQSSGLAQVLPTAWNCLWPQYRRTMKWGPAPPTADIAGRRADLERFREVLGANYLVHMTGGLDHDLAFIGRRS